MAMHWRATGVFIFAIVVGLATDASRAVAFDLRDVLGGAKSCFKRIYKDAHLATHPKQKVDAFGMSSRESKLAKSQFDMVFSVRRRPDRAAFSAIAQCNFEGAAKVVCRLEGDGGQATVDIATVEGKTWVRVRTSGLRFEGDKGFFEFGPGISDDATFLLGAFAIHHCPV